MAEDQSQFERWKAQQDRLPPIVVSGATLAELSTITSALNLYRTRSSEKHTNAPGCGFDKAAESAESIVYRLRSAAG